MTSTEVKSTITLKGSCKMVCEYLKFGVNSILYQRGVYPPETFKTDPDDTYGIPALISQDEKVKSFLNSVLRQAEDWILTKSVHKVSVVITNVQTNENVERWDFDIEYETTNKKDENGEEISVKPLKQVQKEIRDVLRQIISTIAILPLLDCLCSFDILIHTSPNCNIPAKWSETKQAEILNAQIVQLRSFDTGLHHMNTNVTYKKDD